MKKLSLFPVVVMLLFTALQLSSCKLIGDIFKAGVWAGVLLVVGVIAIVILLIRKLF